MPVSTRKLRLSLQAFLLGSLFTYFVLSGTRNLRTPLNPPCRATNENDLPRMLAHAFKQTLDELRPKRLLRTHDRDFYRIIKSVEVGLHWNWFPERYWEKEVLPRLDHLVNIIDVGANEGQFALPNGRRGHTVFSFEPNSDTCESLKRSIISEQLSSKVSLFCISLSCCNLSDARLLSPGFCELCCCRR